jgi:hypothetical protein
MAQHHISKDSIHISHISEKKFSDCCEEFTKYGLLFSPASWDYRDYPDVGFATLWSKEGTTPRIVWGHSKYSHRDNGTINPTFVSEDLITVYDENEYEETLFIDTKTQLRKLIKKTFKIGKAYKK